MSRFVLPSDGTVLEVLPPAGGGPGGVAVEVNSGQNRSDAGDEHAEGPDRLKEAPTFLAFSEVYEDVEAPKADEKHGVVKSVDARDKHFSREIPAPR